QGLPDGPALRRQRRRLGDARRKRGPRRRRRQLHHRRRAAPHDPRRWLPPRPARYALSHVFLELDLVRVGPAALGWAGERSSPSPRPARYALSHVFLELDLVRVGPAALGWAGECSSPSPPQKCHLDSARKTCYIRAALPQVL